MTRDRHEGVSAHENTRRDHGTVGLFEVLREWGRIGCLGFGGPPVHIAMLHDLCVKDRAWLDDEEFEDGIAATNLLPGPASTQLAIYCAWRVRGWVGAALGGAAFIVPGLVAIIILAMLFLADDPPLWLLGLGAGAGAAVPAVAFSAGVDLVPGSIARAAGAARVRWFIYVAIGVFGVIFVGAWLVLLLIVCGFLEIGARRVPGLMGVGILPATSAMAGFGGIPTLPTLVWTALKVGALSYGGGFVIIPLMRSDALASGWMTDAQFLNAVALGQVTPGPVVQTIAVVGYAAAGLPGALIAAFVAFTPSFAVVLWLAPRFERLRANASVRGFLAGAGPAAVGAILGVAVPLATALSEAWQFAVLAVAVIALRFLGRGVVSVLVVGALVGMVAVLVDLDVP